MAQRRQFSAEFKAKVALEAIRAQRTANEIAGAYGVHPMQVAQWKKQALAELPQVFARRRAVGIQEEEALKAQLYQQIGQLKVELDWLKKKPDWGVEEKRACLEPEHPQISLARQCALLGLARSSAYYQPVGIGDADLTLMRLLDEQYTRTPFYGIRRMTAWLQTIGYAVNHKRVARLLRLMGLVTIYPKPRLS